MSEQTKKETRTTLYLHGLKDKFDSNWKTDPRFQDQSEYARHIFTLGIKADQKEREKQLAALK